MENLGILPRVGFKPTFAFVALIPGGVLILLWVVAFAQWPILTKEEKEPVS